MIERVLIAYRTQYGNTEEILQEIANTLKNKDFECNLEGYNDFRDWEKIHSFTENYVKNLKEAKI